MRARCILFGIVGIWAAFNCAIQKSAAGSIYVLEECDADYYLDFDGLDDYVDLGNKYDLQIRDDFTVAAWIKLRSEQQGSTMGIVGKYTEHIHSDGDPWPPGGYEDGVRPKPPNDSNVPSEINYISRGYGIAVDPSNRLKFYTGGADTPRSMVGNRTLQADKWYHITAVQNGTMSSLYLDGVLEASAVTQVIEDSGGNAYIGRLYSDLQACLFKGSINDVLLYRRALSPDEVAKLGFAKPPSSNGLVGYWSFDEKSGQTVQDLSGNGNQGTLGNSSWPDDSDPSRVDRFGADTSEAYPFINDWNWLYNTIAGNTALSFGDGNTYVTLPARPSSPDGEEMTLALWVMLASNNADRRIGVVAGTIHAGRQLILVRDDNNKYGLCQRNEERFNRIVAGENVFTDTLWHHVALVLTNEMVFLYVDGELEGKTVANLHAWQDVSGNFFVGRGGDFHKSLAGYVDDVRLYDRALSPEEIVLCSWAAPSPNEPNLIGYWDLDEGNCQSVRDQSCYGNNGFLGSRSDRDVSDPQWIATYPFRDAKITFDDPDEFKRRTLTNNLGPRIHVELAEGREPDPAGMMHVSNIVDEDPDSPTFTIVRRGRVKVYFGKISAHNVSCRLRFDYRFTERIEGEVLGIYLSNIPELLPYGYPTRSEHYVRGPALVAPPENWPGSPERQDLASYDFTWELSSQELNLAQGIYIEFELRGPASRSVQINDCSVEVKPKKEPSPPWPTDTEEGQPGVQCLNCCGDIAGYWHCDTGPEDVMAALLHSGLCLDSVHAYAFDPDTHATYVPADADALCLDGQFSYDGKVTVHDAAFIELACIDNFPCGAGLVTANTHNSIAVTKRSMTESDVEAIQGDLIIAGKQVMHVPPNQFDTEAEWHFLNDCLYGFDLDAPGDPFDANYTLASGPHSLGMMWPSTSLARDTEKTLYQINLGEGVVRLSDNKAVISPTDPNLGVDVSSPIWHKDAKVYITTPLPLQDLAFDQAGCAYIVPVLVKAMDGSGEAHHAVAKLAPEPDVKSADHYKISGLYSLFDASDYPTYVSRYELETGGKDHLFVFDAGDYLAARESSLLFLTSSTMTRIREFGFSSFGNNDTLTAFYVSPIDEVIFLAFTKSTLAEWPNQSYITRVTGAFWESDDPVIEVCKIVASPMCCFTGITENPTTLDLWLAGFALDDHSNAVDTVGNVRNGSSIGFAPLYKAYLTKLPAIIRNRKPGDSPYQTSTDLCKCLSDYGIDAEYEMVDQLSLPLSIIWNGDSSNCDL